MGPEAAKSFPGRRLVRALPQADQQPAGRARQEIDYGRRGKGYIFGAFQPASGAALTAPDRSRTIANWVAFLERVAGGIPPEAERIYAIVDTLNVPRATDVLLFALAQPRWEVVFQPKYAAYLNLIDWRPSKDTDIGSADEIPGGYHRATPWPSARRAAPPRGAAVS